MAAPLAELQRLGLKLACAEGVALPAHDLVPVWHRWIQQRAVEQLLIDVADYEHVPEGPAVVLVAHEGNYALDGGDGVLGLMYYRKQPAAGDLAARLASLARTVLTAARLLEQDPALGGKVRFRADRLELFANDRLRAPNVAATYAAFQPTLDALLETLFPGTPCDIQRPSDPRDRFTLRITAPQPATVDQLLARLG